MVVSKFFYVHPYFGKIPVWTTIFQRGWNHQLDKHHKPFLQPPPDSSHKTTGGPRPKRRNRSRSPSRSPCSPYAAPLNDVPAHGEVRHTNGPHATLMWIFRCFPGCFSLIVSGFFPWKLNIIMKCMKFCRYQTYMINPMVIVLDLFLLVTSFFIDCTMGFTTIKPKFGRICLSASNPNLGEFFVSLFPSILCRLFLSLFSPKTLNTRIDTTNDDLENMYLQLWRWQFGFQRIDEPLGE